MKQRFIAIAIGILLGSSLNAAAPDAKNPSPEKLPTGASASSGKNVEVESDLDLGDVVKLELVLIRPGSFMMGDENDRESFRLPSEAEWEYACRAGSTTRYCFGDEVANLADNAWYRRDDDPNPNPKVKGVADTHPVGQKKPNAWGLYDMHGNVWEWCQSGWKGYPYAADDGREATLPREPLSDKNPRSMVDAKVLRGGSWHHGGKASSSFNRAASNPVDHRYYYGCRVALSVQN